MSAIDRVFNPHSSHRVAFLRSWLADPWNVASVTPSGRSLARLMARDLWPGARVVEFGPGTGTVTQAILESGVSPDDLYLVERHAKFVEILKQRFPKAHVVEADAAEVATRLPHLLGTADFVISGLPLSWFDKKTKATLLSAAKSLLSERGCLHQFTYLGPPPVGRKLLRSVGLKSSLIGVAAVNVPPAFVYRFSPRLA
jgi:phospholipid N-methyltransferase